MMRRLLLVRHGETTWNTTGRYQGQTDVPLNDVGRQQAAAIAERLAAETIDAIYASDLIRAYETAQAIAKPHKLNVQADPRLREFSFGEWHGLTYAQMTARFPEQVAWWNADRLHRAPPGGETLAQVAVRLQAALDDIPHNHPDQTVLLVAHGGPIRVLLCLLLNKSPREFWQFDVGNTALTEFVFHDIGPRLTRFNDTHHLRMQEAGGKRHKDRRQCL